MHDRTPWTRGRTGDFQLKNTKGKERTYRGLTEFTRPCATCGEPFAIHVTAKIAAGEADSNSFGLKNCEQHRRNFVATEAVTNETLRMANDVMKQELAGLYERNQELFAEVQVLKARLAQYELQPAMEFSRGRVVKELPFDLEEAQANGDAALTFPWQNT
jgi:hypothetical protein